MLRRLCSIVEAIGQRSRLLRAAARERGRAPPPDRAVRRAASSWRTRSPRIRCCSMSCSTSASSQTLPEPRQLAHDLDARMRAARRATIRSGRWKRCATSSAPPIFRIAVADLTGRLPLMKVSDRLTDVAELIVERRCDSPGSRCVRSSACRCAVKAGDAAPCASRPRATASSAAWSSAIPPISTSCSCTTRTASGRRRTPRVRSTTRCSSSASPSASCICSRCTRAAGRLYEVDVRLRPSGKGGMLVTQHPCVRRLPAQGGLDLGAPGAAARARGRGRAGAAAREFERVRLRRAAHHVRRETLREEVRSMRERMRKRAEQGAGRASSTSSRIAGGIADIEFLAQYWALRMWREHPPVAMFSDTIRQLESVASADLVPQATRGRADAAPIGATAPAAPPVARRPPGASSRRTSSPAAGQRSPRSGSASMSRGRRILAPL